MSTHITGKNFELTEAIQSYIEEKMKTLEKLADAITAIDVEVDKNMHHKKGEVFHVRVNVQIPHGFVHAEETRDDLYAAIDICRDEVERQMSKQKEKWETKRRNAGNTRRSFKSIFRFWNKNE